MAYQFTAVELDAALKAYDETLASPSAWLRCIGEPDIKLAWRRMAMEKAIIAALSVPEVLIWLEEAINAALKEAQQ